MKITEKEKKERLLLLKYFPVAHKALIKAVEDMPIEEIEKLLTQDIEDCEVWISCLV